MLNRTIRCIWIGHDPEESADSASASEDDGAATANETSDGVLLSETVYYADGTRAGVKTPDDGYWTTRYIGSLIYEGEPGQETLEGVVTDNGFIQWNGSAASSRMQYFLRDHLGSVRVIAEDRHTVISRTDYLPFGVRMSGDGLTGGNATSRSSFFGFSGKENEMWDGYDTADGDITPHWLKGERYQHFGARAYDPVSCIFMQVDPMAEKYYGMTPYGYCAGNPVMMVDPDGLEWKDINGKVITDHSKIRVYILYDPKSFSRQSKKMYKDAELKYGKGSVAMSSAITEESFVQDWASMSSKKTKEVNLNYHGNNQTLMLDSERGEYLTATGDGKSNRSETPATNVKDLPSPSGIIENAQLNINSCKSNNRTQYPLKGEKMTLMESFYKYSRFETVRGTSSGVSYGRFNKQPFPGHSWKRGTWDYLKRK